MTYSLAFNCTSEHAELYSPPVISNGELTCLIDYTGQQTQKRFLPGNSIPTPRIWWAGRRARNPQFSLFSFGHFEQSLAMDGIDLTEPDSWEQSLDPYRAVTECLNNYQDGLRVKTSAFVFHDAPVLAVRKQITNQTDHNCQIVYSFKYVLDAFPGQQTWQLPTDMTVSQPHIGSSNAYLEYTANGIYNFRGIIQLLCSHNSLHAAKLPNGFEYKLTFRLKPCETFDVHFKLIFCDNLENEDYRPHAQYLKNSMRKTDFDNLLSKHAAKWAEYWQENCVEIPDHTIQNAYIVANYHLKCISTRWSIPTGISETHWHGRYFAFDEFYSVSALLASGHHSMARKVPKFRFEGLRKAIDRASTKADKEPPKARYPWETLEDGTEGAPAGFWMDHVFHMAHITLSAWQTYRYTNDLIFLKDMGYPVIKACAEFYRQFMLYEVTDGRLIVGYCTDFERLGTCKSNAFATTCGVIATFKAAAEAAARLHCDEPLATQWTLAASRLHESLPNNGTRYLSYPDCPDANIGLLGGIFPYQVNSPTNQLQLAAVNAVINNKMLFGNMYAVGQGVCSWYGGWQAAVAARLHRPADVQEALQEVMKNIGSFFELFEICEPERKLFFRPWFSTGEAMFIQGVDDALLCSDEKSLDLLPGAPPEWQDIHYKLAAIGGLTVELTIKDRKLAGLTLTNHTDEHAERQLHFPLDLRVPVNVPRNVTIPANDTYKVY